MLDYVFNFLFLLCSMFEKVWGKMCVIELIIFFVIINIYFGVGGGGGGGGQEERVEDDEEEEELMKIVVVGVGLNGYVFMQEWVFSW